jgi:hypothetical protein
LNLTERLRFGALAGAHETQRTASRQGGLMMEAILPKPGKGSDDDHTDVADSPNLLGTYDRLPEVAVVCEPVSPARFPAHREKYREFLRFREFRPIWLRIH